MKGVTVIVLKGLNWVVGRCGVFVLGGILNQYQFQCNLLHSVLLVVLKLVVLPFMVWLFSFKLFDIDVVWASVALLTSAMPIGINAYFFAANYAVNESTVASSIIISTVVSKLTLSILIVYVQSEI